MKKNLLLAFSSFVGMLLLFSSCKKELNNPNADEIGSTPLPNPTTYCRIESVWTNPGTMMQKFFVVGYDEFENPTFISTPVPTTGQPFRIFKYDNWHRLREFIGTYDGFNFEEWHLYGFDLNGRIGYDTVYTLGTGGQRPITFNNRIDLTISYDNMGRIIRVFGGDMHGTPVDVQYQYDASGNLVRPGVTYDNKVNALRTNDIWMFLARDYSMNNPGMATSYNAAGYPLAFVASGVSLPVGSNTGVQISYACRPSFFH